MYGYTPPLVVAVAADVLGDVAGFQRVAAALADELAKRPAWVAVQAHPRLVQRCMGADLDLAAVADTLESLEAAPDRSVIELDPAVDTPRTWLERATADILRHHLLDLGLDLPIIELSADAPLPRRASAILCAGILRQPAGNYQLLESDGSPLAAVTAARELGSSRVILWQGSREVSIESAIDVAKRHEIEIQAQPVPSPDVKISASRRPRHADA